FEAVMEGERDVQVQGRAGRQLRAKTAGRLPGEAGIHDVVQRGEPFETRGKIVQEFPGGEGRFREGRGVRGGGGGGGCRRALAADEPRVRLAVEALLQFFHVFRSQDRAGGERFQPPGLRLRVRPVPVLDRFQGKRRLDAPDRETGRRQGFLRVVELRP